jgi:hypothetical protein
VSPETLSSIPVFVFIRIGNVSAPMRMIFLIGRSFALSPFHSIVAVEERNLSTGISSARINPQYQDVGVVLERLFINVGPYVLILVEPSGEAISIAPVEMTMPDHE